MSTESDILTAEGERNPFALDTQPAPEFLTWPLRCTECGQRLRHGDTGTVCYDCKIAIAEEELRYA